MMERRLFLLQRLSAMLLFPLVCLHLLLILYAARQGITADQILARTSGSVFWALLYGLFVFLVAVHAPIGLRNVMSEWLNLSKPVVNKISIVIFILFLVLGLRSVAAVVAPGS